MKKVTIDETVGKILYGPASSEGKKVLEQLFGKKVLAGDAIERVNSIAAAYEETGRPVITHPSELPEDLHSFILRLYDFIVVAEGMNDGEKLSFANTDQEKWYPWLRLLPAGGVGYYGAGYRTASTVAGDAARLRFISERAAKAFGTNPEFQKLAIDLMNL